MKYVKKKDLMATLFLGLLCVGLSFLPSGFEEAAHNSSNIARGIVVSVDNSDVRQNLLVKTGTQELQVRIENGPYKGSMVSVMNTLQGKMEIDEVYRAENPVLLEFAVKDGKVKQAYARGKYRIRTELILFGMFALLLLAVGGWTGAKALLSFLFTALMLWKVMIPLFLHGKDPVIVSLLAVSAMTAAICFLVGGVNRKGVVTFAGALMGLGLTCLLAIVFSRHFYIHGAVRPFAETLLYSGFYNLNLTKIFLAAIFVGSAGAVMDLAMDISSAMHEIKEKHPGISIKEHIKSGLSVGKSVIGTMTTTLLLAYSGSYMAMMMLFVGQGIPVVTIFNLNFVAAEFLNIMVGSFGLVTVAPFTALIGGLVYARQEVQA